MTAVAPTHVYVCFCDQVAERQGKYLAQQLNQLGKAGGGRANSAKDIHLGDVFVYRHLGSMATIGRYKALVDLRQSKVILFFSFLFFIYRRYIYINNCGWTGGQRLVYGWFSKLVHLAISLSYTCRKLEEQILRSNQLAYNPYIWP